MDNNQFGPVDEAFDYEAQTDEWTNEPATAEATLDAIQQSGRATQTGEAERVEGCMEPAGDERDTKRYVLSEPDTRAGVDALPTALVRADHFALVAAIVDEPRMYRKRWDREHTPLERDVLWQLCCQFIKAEQIVPMELVQQAEQRFRE